MRDVALTGENAGHVLVHELGVGHEAHKPVDPQSTDDKSLEGTFAVAEIDSEDTPTEEERETLRRVPGHVNAAGYMLCFIEGANNASYYGVSGVFTNFIQRPLPAGGNGAGAPPKGTQQSAGALGLGLQTATALTVLFSFLAYCTPLLGGYIADAKIGRYKSLWVGIIIGFFSHVLLVIAAIPSVIKGGHGIAPFIIGLLSLAFASGFIKPAIAPMIADQSTVKRQYVKALPTGERVIVDPNVTVERMLLLYYWASNLGDFFSIATSYAEKRIGFWLAYLLPGIVYMLMPPCLLWVRSRITLYPASGSSVVDATKVTRLAIKHSKALKVTPESWEAVKPSNLRATGEFEALEAKHKPGWISWDDKFVDELKATFRAFRVFIFFPIWYLADGGTNSILTNMAGSMTTNGLPNDLLSNFNPISTVIAIPIYNWFLYPTLRKMGVRFGLIQRICVGYIIGAVLNAVGAILQWRVYKTSPCGYYATECTIGTGVSPLSAWLVIIPFWLQPLGGIFISVSAYEMAYTLTPPRMKGTIIAVVFFTSALSQAILEICTPAYKDPHLIWPFVGISLACLCAAVANYYFFHDMDEPEGTDLHRMDLTPEEIAKQQASTA
ncbi:POT family-domain-containing protein [Naematelia encephala]|uniref:POT family-domain-containing protein n=1 Tax=Naematelia encephala TaxID=71784 RepID=A0A1Y2ASR0_9TREE|nr:POT family-domain-containing protein [Naematelia encephala]